MSKRASCNNIRRSLTTRALPMALVLLFAGLSTPALRAEAPSGSAVIFYVHPEGRNNWSGRLASPNAQKTDGPLASITAARNAVRKLRKKEGGLKRPVTVEIADGVYRISRTILFTSKDSGTSACPITYAAAPGAKPVISGGRIIENWKRSAGGTYWSATIPDVKDGKWSFNQLFVAGVPYTLARWPDAPKRQRFEKKGLSPKNATAVCAKDGIKNWRRADTPRAVLYRSWDLSRFRIRSYDKRSRVLRMKRLKGKHPITHWPGDRRYFLEDSLSFCNMPGEWFLDRKKGILYFYLLKQHKTDKPIIEAPRVDRLMRITGTEDNPVRHLTFKGLTFSNSACDIPEEGFDGHQAGVEVEGSIEADFLESSVFFHCKFTGLGRNALWLRKGCTDNIVTRCEFTDLAAGAVYVGEDRRHGVTFKPETTRNEISNNHVYKCGRIWLHCVGIWVGPASYTRIAHNHVHHLPYSGVSVGWCWNPKPSNAHHNIIEYNYIHHIMLEMADGGGIYTLGLQPGTILRNNIIHDSRGSAPAWHANGIYHDQGSSGMLDENNIVYRIAAFGFQLGKNANNIHRNNIVAFCKDGFYVMDGENLVSERNIVFHMRGILNLRTDTKKFRSDNNLYFNPKTALIKHFNPRAKPGKIVVGAKYTFEKWKAEGGDPNTIIADPLFVDPVNGDFSLKPNSPAFKIGFKPIDISKVGIQNARRSIR